MDPADTPIWLRPQEGRRGPRPRHSLDEIADAAVRIADADGLDGLSMRGVADALGTGPASLYRYVESKTDLEDLMVDRVAGEYVYPPPTGEVRDDILAILDQIRASRRRHPWLADIRAPALGPHGVRLLDGMVAALAPLRAGAGPTMLGVALLSGWAMNFGSLEAAGDLAGLTRGSAHLGALIDAEQHPHLAALFAADSSAEPGPGSMDVDETFRRGIDSLLAGIEAQARGSQT